MEIKPLFAKPLPYHVNWHEQHISNLCITDSIQLIVIPLDIIAFWFCREK
jgi:hypothetical protein